MVWQQVLNEQLFSMAKCLFQFRNVISPPEIYAQKRLGTAKTHVYIVEMF